MILYHYTMILISQQIFLHSAFPFWRSWGSVCYAFKVMTAAEAKFYRDGLEAQIDLGSSYLPTHLWYITDTVDETKSCMWLYILTTSIVAFSCFFTISTVAEVCASAVWLKGIFLFRDLGISWGHKWRTQFVSFMFEPVEQVVIWGSPLFKTTEMLDALMFLDYPTWTDGMSRFLTIGIQHSTSFNYMCIYFQTVLRIIKLAIMVGMDVHSSSPLPS